MKLNLIPEEKTKLTDKAYISPVTTLASSGQTASMEGSLAESHENIWGIVSACDSRASLVNMYR
jgi:hypothetical protein